jgi:peptidoglycan biosynthesis protein MviN/MurJ (putative lipid II flippase)
MNNLLIVLGVLFIGLIVMVNIAKWTGPSTNSPNIQKLRRYLFPLLIISLLLQLGYLWLNKN